MRKGWEILQELEADNSRLAKEAIIEREALAGNQEFFLGVKQALDPFTTFGIKQVPEKTNDNPSTLSVMDFYNSAMMLADRKLTGDRARDEVRRLMTAASQVEWNGWYRRILIKDLRCGVSEKTINKVVEKKYAHYSVPIFSCQLAHDSANHESKVSGKKLIEVKLDGVRVITIVYPGGRVDQYSRNGKELVNFEKIKQQLADFIRASDLSEPIVLDGEVMSSSFQDLMKQVHRKSDVAADDAVLHLFDLLPLTNFSAGRWDSYQLIRSENLKEVIDKHQDVMPNVRTVGYELVNLDTEEGQTRFKEINAQAIAGGYEGIMIKDPMSPYECKRTTSWLKLKPFIEVSLNITAVEEGTGRNQGKLGAFVCEGEDDGRTIRVNVGSGFSDSNRDDYWAGRTELPGKVVEVRADAVTQNQDGSYSLRFPRFLRFRGFKDGEKL